MTNERIFDADQDGLFSKFQAGVAAFVEKDGLQIPLGVAEMAAGAGIIAWAVNNGWLTMGAHLVATAPTGWNPLSVAGAATAGGLGATAGALLGGIGIAGAGSAIGIPAAIVAGGAAVVLGTFGYAAGDMLNGLINPMTATLSASSLIGTGATLLVGMGLLVHGARRIIKTPSARDVYSSCKDGVLTLKPIIGKKLFDTQEALQQYTKDFMAAHGEKVGIAVDGAVIAGSGIAGGCAAAALATPPAATLFGSATLGGLATSWGVLAAPAAVPVWPVIAGGAATTVLGYAAWRLIKKQWAERAEGGGQSEVEPSAIQPPPLDAEDQGTQQ